MYKKSVTLNMEAYFHYLEKNHALIYISHNYDIKWDGEKKSVTRLKVKLWYKNNYGQT